MTRPKRNAPPNPDTPRVFRGGSWNGHGASWMRAASPRTGGPANRGYNFGFRVTLAGRVRR